MAERHGDDRRLSIVHKLSACPHPFGLVRQRLPDELLQLAEARLDEPDALPQGGCKRDTRSIKNQPGPSFLGKAGKLGVGIVGDAWRQTSARDDVVRLPLNEAESFQATM